MKKFFTAPRTIITLVFVGIALAANTAAAQTAADSPIMDVNPFLNLLALALVIERLIEIVIVLIPGIEEKKLNLADDLPALASFQLKLQRITLGVGLVMGVLFCTIFKFGILDEIFPGQMSPFNSFNHVVTGLIAGSGSEPVHQLVLIIIGIRDKLRVGNRKA